MTALVRLSLEGRSVRIRPAGYLGELWGAYVRATEGCRYDRKTRASYVPVERVEQVVLRLREEGIGHEPTPELREIMQRTSKAAWNDLCAVRERIDRIDVEMQARSGEKLFPFQRYGAQWLAPRRGALLADDQGLGKTRTTIAALPANAPVIVVGPSITKGVWSAEIARFRPQIRTRILAGRGSFRWPEAGEAVLTSFELLPPLDMLHAGGCDGKLPPEPCKACRTVERVRPFGSGIESVLEGHVPECPGFKLQKPLAKCDGCAGGGEHHAWCKGYKVLRATCDGCHPFLSQARPGTVFVIDEAHYLKSPTAQRTLAAKAIASACRAREGRTWQLTGTPLENDARELWCVLSLAGIAEEAFGTYKKCIEVFKGRKVPLGRTGHVGYQWDDASEIDQDDVVERLKRVSLRRLKSEVLPQLPQKTWRTLPVAIDKKTYAECERVLKGGVNIEQIEADLEAGRDELRFEGMSAIRAALATAKIPAMLEYVEEMEAQNEPLVVFSAHRAPLDKLAKRRGWEAIVGGVSAEEKTRIAEAFQRGELRGVACSIRAAGVAITLHRANQMLFVDLDWKPTANAQAADRVCRIGQKRGCQMTVLAAEHPLDERVSEIVRRKTLLISHTIDASSVDDDAPRDAALEEDIRKLQEAVAGGRAVRREAESDAEKTAIERISRLAFLSARDERLATDLTREADAIGLSDAQWSLVVKLSSLGREVVTVADSKGGAENAEP